MKLGKSRGMVHPQWGVQKGESGYYRVRGPNGIFPRGRGATSRVRHTPRTYTNINKVWCNMYMYHVAQYMLCVLHTIYGSIKPLNDSSLALSRSKVCQKRPTTRRP